MNISLRTTKQGIVTLTCGFQSKKNLDCYYGNFRSQLCTRLFPSFEADERQHIHYNTI